MIDVADVEAKANQIKATGVEIGIIVGNVQIADDENIAKISKRLSMGGVAIPPHCRDQVGTIYALILQAIEWRMPIMSVINKSYVVNNRGIERIAYESQLIHAIIERNAPLKNRIRYEITGEGDERRCKVWATFRGEEEPHVYHSETLARLRDAKGRNENGVLKGSPLWDHQPEVQLFYSASRTWARINCPDVILGAYTPEDPQYIDVTPPIPAWQQSLRNKMVQPDINSEDRGFDVAHVTREAGRRTVVEGDYQQEADNEDEGRSGGGRKREPDQQERGERGAGGAATDTGAEGRAEAVAADRAAVTAAAGPGRRAEKQAEEAGKAKDKAKDQRK